MHMDQIPDRLPGIIAIHDDICIYGKMRTRSTLVPTDKNSLKNGLVFNSHRCIRQPQITYLEHVLQHKGWNQTQQRYKLYRPPHTRKSEQFQSFLGLISYLQLFLPDLASKTRFFWEQVSHCHWKPSTDAAFHWLKQLICNSLLKIILTYFIPTKCMVIQTNVSEYGLGVGLIQDRRHITFAPKTQTDVKTRYANIEHEWLPVCFGLEKFHKYVYGRHITVHNYHKPLKVI